MGKRVGGGGARVSPSRARVGPGTYPEQSSQGGREADGATVQRAMESGAGRVLTQPSSRPAWKNFIPASPDAPRTVAVKNAEAK